MAKESLPLERTEGPWRPAVAFCRPQAPHKRHTTRPLPGQLYLPGMEAIDLKGNALPRAGHPTCPNCGGDQFDDDGDCTACWEPGVVERT